MKRGHPRPSCYPSRISWDRRQSQCSHPRLARTATIIRHLVNIAEQFPTKLTMRGRKGGGKKTTTTTTTITHPRLVPAYGTPSPKPGSSYCSPPTANLRVLLRMAIMEDLHSYRYSAFQLTGSPEALQRQSHTYAATEPDKLRRPPPNEHRHRQIPSRLHPQSGPRASSGACGPRPAGRTRAINGWQSLRGRRDPGPNAIPWPPPGDVSRTCVSGNQGVHYTRRNLLTPLFPSDSGIQRLSHVRHLRRSYANNVRVSPPGAPHRGSARYKYQYPMIFPGDPRSRVLSTHSHHRETYPRQQ